MTDTSEANSAGITPQRRDRSPAFPFIPLSQAIGRAEAMGQAFRRHPARIENVASHWGYKPTSSGTAQTIAALKSFGLIEITGTGTSRKVQLTDLARRILSDERPGAWEKAIAEAAIKPKLIAEYWEHWRMDRPMDAECISELTLEKGFNDIAARRFLKVYDDTIAFTNPLSDDRMSLEGVDKNGDGDRDGPTVAVGAYIQWESEGALQFPTPRRVTGVSEDETFVFVEGSNTGIPMSEIQLAEKPEVPAEAPESQKRLPKKPGIIEATLPLEEGLAVLQLPDQLTDTSYQDLGDWLELMLRRAKRSVPTRPLREEERAILGAMGYSDDDINELSPWRARDILNRNVKKSDSDEAPSNT
ncbi:MAG: hypothetical protein IIA72_17045 [Proteobacteria bacterium]|nr:hypothetical protein [Pseudomonadota bacterium]